jgi:DinB superfamily
MAESSELMTEILEFLPKTFLEVYGASLPDVLEHLRAARENFCRQLEGLNLDDSGSNPAPHGWTPAHIAEHTNTANAFFAICLERTVKGKAPIVMPRGRVTPDGRAINPAEEPRGDTSPSELLETHGIACDSLERGARGAETAGMLESICVIQSFFGPLSCLEVLRLATWHTGHHAAQIAARRSEHQTI